MAYELGLLDAEFTHLTALIRGPKNDMQNVELYDGSRGVSIDFVNQHERPIGQLQWLNDLHQRFSGNGDSPGTVTGVRWGSGALIGPDLFLTAGHCFDQTGNGWLRPKRNGLTILPSEIASLMLVNFNYQKNGQLPGHPVRPGEPFPVVELLEHSLFGIDYAIVRLGRNPAGQLPGDVYGTLTLAAQDLTTPGAIICVIQYPQSRAKMIDAGPIIENRAGRITYNSFDTDDGSSGSPILSAAGEIVGVHVFSGSLDPNDPDYGQSIGAIRAASNLL